MLEKKKTPAAASRWRRTFSMLTWLVPVALLAAMLLPAVGHLYLWRDEFATWEFARLPIPELFRAVHHVDLVLLPYYAAMHIVQAVGLNGTGLRIPSVLAALCSVAVVAALARRWWGRLAGIAAGTALAFNPLFVQLALDARPYSISVFFVASSTLFLDRAVRPSTASVKPWIGYTLCLTFAGLLHPYAVLVAAAHFAMTIARNRQALIRHVVCLVVVAAAMAPILLLARTQTEQVGWIAPPSPGRAVAVLANEISYAEVQRVTKSALIAGVAFLLAVAVCLLPVAQRVRSRRPLITDDRATLCAIGMAVLPWLALLAVSVVAFPTLTTHYLGPSTIGIALILGRALSLVVRRIHARMPHRGERAGYVVTACAIVVLGAGFAANAHSTLAITHDHVWQDNFHDLARVMRADARMGDTLAVVQHYDQGGFAAGVAYYLHDVPYEENLRSELASGTQPVVSVRTISETSPWRTETNSNRIPSGGRVWVVNSSSGMLPLDVTNALKARGCYPVVGPTTAFGAVYLRRVTCSAD